MHPSCRGQEAAQVGSAAALRHDDWSFPQYRELGLLLMRGIPASAVGAAWHGGWGFPEHACWTGRGSAGTFPRAGVAAIPCSASQSGRLPLHAVWATEAMRGSSRMVRSAKLSIDSPNNVASTPATRSPPSMTRARSWSEGAKNALRALVNSTPSSARRRPVPPGSPDRRGAPPYDHHRSLCPRGRTAQHQEPERLLPRPGVASTAHRGAP
ncbi:thiamine pyrophosphate-dependent enzyme [Streptomyces sp. NPDC001930]|uniref:thiamine pyrophosphate-dependent enzyme n=1 Tax=Streptomyces sp. NPDC001930 TaxID=3364625 RepID=UPI0036C1A6B9